MGNIFFCLTFNKRPKRPLKKFSNKRDEDNVEDEQRAIVPKRDATFNWSSMQNVLLEINTNVYSRKITRQDIIAADNMLSYIDQDISYHCNTLLDRLLASRRTYAHEFEEYANNYRIIPLNKHHNILKCRLHNYHMIHLHKKILNALQYEGNPFEILDLLALNHAAMKVTTSDFKVNILFIFNLT